MTSFGIDSFKFTFRYDVTKIILHLLIQMYTKYLKQHPEFKTIVSQVKELFKASKHNHTELSKLIDTYLIPQENEKKQNAEVSTPYALRQEMLNSIPKDFWTQPRTVFEPCCGKGGFVLDVVNRFMEGLQKHEPNEEKRYKLIVEKCVYFADINPVNIFITRLLFDPNEQYNLLYYEGNTLDIDLDKSLHLNSFDLVVGNPPYNSSGSTATGNTLWPQFVSKAIEEWLKISKGYLLFVHPPGWRKPASSKSKYNNMFELMAKKCNIICLYIYGLEKGKEMFRCGTRYDWYLLRVTSKQSIKTYVQDEQNKIYKIDISSYPFLPNSNIDLLSKIVAQGNEARCNIIYNRSNYATDNKKWVSSVETDVFCNPLVHSTKKSGTTFYYSSRTDNGHFGISKVIFGQTGISNVIVDMKGNYGLTDNAMAILINSEEEGLNIKKVLLSDTFRKILDSCSWSNYRIDWRLFSYFKNDWWKEF